MPWQRQLRAQVVQTAEEKLEQDELRVDEELSELQLRALRQKEAEKKKRREKRNRQLVRMNLASGGQKGIIETPDEVNLFSIGSIKSSDTLDDLDEQVCLARWLG